MSEPFNPEPPPQQYGTPPPPQQYGAPPQQYGTPAPQYGAPAPGYGQPAYGGAPMGGQLGPVGKIRSTGTCILLSIVTLGLYSLVWYFSTSEEMKKHSGQGLGGGLSLIIAVVIGIATPFITSSEVGGLYQRAGRPAPVTGTTGLWYFPGIFLFFIGPIVWFVKTNGALNDYWKSMGATA
ncbi:hypothetical protein BH11ACT8_BH11ACT8_12510 [soil metagenome]